jgi:RES domain-containing protein
MKVFRISKCRYIEDFSGFGAANYPGRWNSEGTHVLYTASSASLAMLEILVHLHQIPAQDFCMASLEIPDNDIVSIDKEDLPEQWWQYPSPDRLKKIGDRFVREGEYLALRLPSSIIKEDDIVLINPAHRSILEMKVIYIQPIDIDQRLLKLK